MRRKFIGKSSAVYNIKITVQIIQPFCRSSSILPKCPHQEPKSGTNVFYLIVGK